MNSSSGASLTLLLILIRSLLMSDRTLVFDQIHGIFSFELAYITFMELTSVLR